MRSQNSDLQGAQSFVSVNSQTSAAVNTADYQVEIALLGDTGVGKSSLLYRYSDGVFKHDLIGTAGVDHKQKNIVH